MARLIGDILTELKTIQIAFEDTHDVEALRRCIENYQELLNEAPDDPEIVFQLGTAHLQLQQYGTALVFFQRVIEFWPDAAQLWSNLGCCYRAMHILPEAREAFMKSLMLGGQADTYSNLGSSYVNEDNPEEGIKYSEIAIQMSPDKPKARWNAALLYLELKDWAKGFAFYDAGFFCGERQLRNYTNEKPDTVPWWDGVCA